MFEVMLEATPEMFDWSWRKIEVDRVGEVGADVALFFNAVDGGTGVGSCTDEMTSFAVSS